MDKYSFLHKSLITQSVACSNDGIISVFYMYIVDSFAIQFIPYEPNLDFSWNVENWKLIWLGTILLLILLGHFVV